MKSIRYGSSKLHKIISRNVGRRRQVIDKVARIVEDVRTNGDTALLRYTRKFDKVKLLPKEIKVSEDEINACYQNIQPEFVSSLKTAIDNVTRFYSKRVKKAYKINSEDGVLLTEKIRPLETVGVYIPAGTVRQWRQVYKMFIW